MSDLEKAPQGTSTEDAKDLLIEDRGHVRLLTLDRPHRANALSPELMSALERFRSHGTSSSEPWDKLRACANAGVWLVRP